MSARDNILSASSFALAERYAQLLEFQTDLESQIVKLEDRKDDAARDALRARRRALADTAKEIGLNERIRAQLEARSQLEQSIVEARLRALNAAIDARDLERQSLRNANAAEDFAAERARLTSEIDNPNADFAASRDELTRLISQAQADAANPAAQARFARDRARLEAQIARATARGDLDARDAAEQQLAALEERYGADRVSRLQAQLQALNDEEAARVNRAREDRDRLDIEEQQRLDDITRAANEASAATAGFIGDLKELIDSLMTGAVSFGSFVAQLSALGIGIPADSGFAGVIGANQIIPTDGIPEMTVRGKIQDYLRNRDKGTYNASAIGRATGLSRATVWKNRSAAPSGYKIKNRVSGGYLNPGALTLVGETGPELIVSPGGGQVISGSRTQRMGSAGGVTLNVYPRTSANDPTELARALGWQLATR